MRINGKSYADQVPVGVLGPLMAQSVTLPEKQHLYLLPLFQSFERIISFPKLF
jgi:hypothetical protein